MRLDFQRFVRSLLHAGLVALSLLCPADWVLAQSTPPRYSIVELSGVPRQINDNGEIAGWIYVGADAHAAIYRGGAWQDLGVPAGDQLSTAFGINSAGAVVGYSFASLPGPDYRWQATWAPGGSASLEPLSALAPDSFAYAINDSGAIVGCRNRYDDIYPDPHRAFLYSVGSVIDLHSLIAMNPVYDFTCARGINNAGVVVGEYQSASAPQRGFMYQNGTVTLLAQSPNAYLTNARAISNAGKIVGDGRLAGFTADHAVMYDITTGGIASLGAESTGAYNSQPNDVNERDEVVGMMFLSVGEHAFLASGGRVFDLNDLIPAGSDWVLQEAISINDRGQIIGRGYRPSSATETRYFLLTLEPQDPRQCIARLDEAVRAVVAGGHLGRGHEIALRVQVHAASALVLRGNFRPAAKLLETFVRYVEALIRAGKLPAAAGQPLIDAAQCAIDGLASPPDQGGVNHGRPR